MVLRQSYKHELTELLDDFPVVAIPGVRQEGKTTLACQIADSLNGVGGPFELESPIDLARLFVVHAGDKRFPLAGRVEALSVEATASLGDH